MAEIVSPTREKTRKDVAEQVARIAGKIVTRASNNNLSHGHYGGRDAYSMRKEGPIAGTHIKTQVEIDDFGMARVNRELSNNISETGVSVSAVPNVGIDAVSRGRSGGEKVNSHLKDDQEKAAIADVPAQLSELRGHLAEEEIRKQQRDQEFESRYGRQAA